jgi:hypothetical protein
MIHLTLPPNVIGGIITLLFMTHGIAFVIGYSRRH